MFDRVKKAASAAIEFVEVKALLIVRQGERAAAATVGFAAAGLLVGAGAVALLGAAFLALAPVLGEAGALAIVGVAAVAGGAAVAAIQQRSLQRGVRGPDMTELQERAQAAEAAWKDAAESSSDEPKRDPGGGGLAEQVISGVASNPKLVGSAAFAVVSLLGPRKTLKLASKAVAAGSVLASVMRAEDLLSSNGKAPQRGAEDAAQSAR